MGAVGIRLVGREIRESPNQGHPNHAIGGIMFRGIKEKSCARAWAAACMSIMGTRDQGYNVVIDVADPVTHDAKDNQAITLVDKFLRQHEENPVVTVANTIFPQALYEAYGSPDFYGIYHRDFDKFSRE